MANRTYPYELSVNGQTAIFWATDVIQAYRLARTIFGFAAKINDTYQTTRVRAKEWTPR